jgi:signal transduction histidine kinase
MTTDPQQLTELFTNFSDGICLSSLDGGILYLNPAGKRLIGDHLSCDANSPSLCDSVCAKISGQNGRASCPLRNSEEDSARASLEGFLPGPERSHRLRLRCLGLKTALLDSWEPHKIFSIIEDVSAEHDLEASKEEWRRMIIHDLRSPLTSVYGTLRLLQDSPPNDAPSKTMGTLVANSLHSCDRVMRLLQMYLDVARLEEGYLAAENKLINLSIAAQAAREDISGLCAKQGVTVELLVDENAVAVGDPDLLERALDNLLSNAIRYSRRGDRVFLSARQIGNARTEISVRDMGEGIAPEDLPHVFERFYQSKGPSGRMKRGAGLGLTFCRLAVAAMGGEINVQSREGSGTEFYIRLPAAAAAPSD